MVSPGQAGVEYLEKGDEAEHMLFLRFKAA